MADNLQDLRPADRLRINISEELELEWWSKELGVAPEELRTAVKMLSAKSADIRAVFGKQPNRHSL